MRSEFGPMSPAALEAVERYLHKIQRPRSPEQYATRAEAIARALTSGKPPIELFYFLASVALVGAAECAARDADKPQPAVVIGERPRPALASVR